MQQKLAIFGAVMKTLALNILALLISVLLFACDGDGVTKVYEEPVVKQNVEFEEDSVKGMMRVKASGHHTFLGTASEAAKPNERPKMQVHFTYDFSMDRSEVTCGDFNKKMKPLTGLKIDCPEKKIAATDMTFFDAILYANELSKANGRDTAYEYSSFILDGDKHCVRLNGFNFLPASNGMRLPTEAEWVLVASENWNTNISRNRKNSKGVPNEVCSIRYDTRGFCDMTGNVREWVNDWLGMLRDSSVTNFVGSVDGGSLGSCVIKGGSFYMSPEEIKIFSRGDVYPVLANSRATYVGFRLAYGPIPNPVYFSAYGTDVSSPIVPLVSGSEARAATSSDAVKLVFRNDETKNLVYVNFAAGAPAMVEFIDNLDVYHPEISPDGNHVAFCTSLEGVASESSVYVRDLDARGGHLVKLDVENAAIPRWRVENGDTLIVYVSSTGNNSGSNFLQESTWQVKFSNGKFGKPEKLFDGNYHGGLSADKRLAVTGSPKLRARLESEGHVSDTIWYDGAQACNASLAKDGSNRTLFLDFGGKKGVAFAGEKYRSHEQILIADSTGELIQMVPAPKGLAFDHSEWVGGKFKDSENNLVVVTLTKNGSHSKIAFVDLTDSSVVSLVEGRELWHPSMWLKQRSESEGKPTVNLDSAGNYFDYKEINSQSFSSVELAIKMQSFWKVYKDVEVVVFGSSMLMDAVIEENVKSFKTLNMGVTLSDVHLFEYLLKKYVLPYAPNLKVVVAEFAPGLLYRFRSSHFLPLFKSSPGLSYERRHLNSNTVEDIAANSQLQEYPLDLFEQQYLEGTFLLPSISWGSPSIYVDTTLMTYDNAAAQASMNVIKSMKQMTDAKGVKLVLATTPRTPEYRETGSYCVFGPSWTVARKFIKDAKKMKAVFFDEYNDGDHDYTDEMAYNENHLSYLGAIKFTARLDSLLETLK